MCMRDTVLLSAVVLFAVVALGCARTPEEPTHTPGFQPIPDPDALVNEPDPIPTPTPTATVTPTPTVRPPMATPRPTPTATGISTPTPTPTATPTPVPQRYQVFFDDIELVRGSEAWEMLEHPMLKTCPVSGYLPQTYVRCKTPDGRVDDKLTDALIAENARLNADYRERRGNADMPTSDVFTRLEVIGAANVPESEVMRVKPGICHDLRMVYIGRLALIDSHDPSRFNAFDLQHEVYGKTDSNPWSGHLGHLRQYIIRNCAEYVEFEPYQAAPEGTFDCANYEYQEDAEEARWTYWYAEELQELQRTVTTNDSLFYVLELFHEGSGRELICAYLPSRGLPDSTGNR